MLKAQICVFGEVLGKTCSFAVWDGSVRNHMSSLDKSLTMLSKECQGQSSQWTSKIESQLSSLPLFSQRKCNIK